MNQDMNELIDKAKEIGYALVRYDEFEKKRDEVIRQRYMLVFERNDES